MRRLTMLLFLASIGLDSYAVVLKKPVQTAKNKEVIVNAPAQEKLEDTSKSPLGCRDVGYRYQLGTIDLQPHSVGDKQSLYFFYNHLAQPVKLYHMLGDNTLHATFLNHTIAPKQWAVLATGLEDVKYMCAIHAEDGSLGTITPCQDSIKICEFARVKFGLNNKGNFWIVKGNTRAGAVSEVVHYGIIPQ
jgi:hypothetical protein